jgi:hypothetical protein
MATSCEVKRFTHSVVYEVREPCTLMLTEAIICFHIETVPNELSLSLLVDSS